MSANTNILFVHGINSQSTGYSNSLFDLIIDDVDHFLEEQGMDKDDRQKKVAQYVQKELIWADATLDLTNRYSELQYDLFGKKKGTWNFFTKKIDPLVLQILHYVKDKGDKQSGEMTILQKFDKKFKEISQESKDIIIVAHSLGSVIAFDYLMGFRKYKVDPTLRIKSFITLGSPIPLFISAMGHTDSAIELPTNVESWYNIFDPDDGVARRCKPFFNNIDVKDIHVSTGFFPISAHTKYWDNKNTSWEIAKIINESS